VAIANRHVYKTIAQH